MHKLFQASREAFFIKNKRYPSDRENQSLEDEIRQADQDRKNQKQEKLKQQAEDYRRLKDGS